LIGAIQAIGLRLVEERFGIPLVTILVQPRAAAWDGGDEAANQQFDAMFRPLLNRHRRRASLPPLDVPFHRWMNRATHPVGLFPSWFVLPELDSFGQGEMVGFVRFDGDGTRASQHDLDAFLARHDAPWVFTYGTGNDQAGEFFQMAIEASAQMETAAVLLGCRDDSKSRALPTTVLPLDYAPLGSLLPYCAGIVHHGGIGTCAQAMRAGIPQVVVPMAFDQFLNAARLEQLGVGVTLRRGELSAGRLASVLAGISSDRSVDQRCMQRSREIARDDDALQRCCGIIERIAGAARSEIAPVCAPR
jgi:rhamnosyltransferase subunit B